MKKLKLDVVGKITRLNHVARQEPASYAKGGCGEFHDFLGEMRAAGETSIEVEVGEEYHNAAGVAVVKMGYNGTVLTVPVSCLYERQIETKIVFPQQKRGKQSTRVRLLRAV